MPTRNRAAWEYDAEYIQACNCDWGCPCNMGAKPTMGFCEGGSALSITKGHYDGTNLEGVRFAFFAKWPGQIHEGGGTGAVYIDEKATKSQREAIVSIVAGKATGQPWDIFKATIELFLETKFAPFEWNFKGNHSSFKIGSFVHATLEPMRNPVSGADQSAHITLPQGFVFQEADIASTRSFAVFDSGIKYAHPGKDAHVARVHHSSG